MAYAFVPTRAVRLPSRGEQDGNFINEVIPPGADPNLPLPVPVVIRATSGGEMRAEEIVALEFGYRFRSGNLLVDGLEPWAEMDWLGKTIKLGEAELEIVERTKRCCATEANPETGERDVNTLSALRDGFGHRDCGVYAKVTRGGLVQEGDSLQVPG